jgi:DNA repair protein RAD5
MESPHPDERPNKTRRFFDENSSPAQVRAKAPSSPPPSPPPAVESDVPIQPDAIGTEDAAALDGFDVGMLQAVVGELSLLDLRKLKDVSGNNVERGRHAVPEKESLC